MEHYTSPEVQYGGPAVVVPGQMKGLEQLHARYGKLPWEALLQPSIELAENGIVVTPEMISVGTELLSPHTAHFSGGVTSKGAS
jgi:gamma-glutamyltranspeptidase